MQLSEPVYRLHNAAHAGNIDKVTLWAIVAGARNHAEGSESEARS